MKRLLLHLLRLLHYFFLQSGLSPILQWHSSISTTNTSTIIIDHHHQDENKYSEYAHSSNMFLLESESEALCFPSMFSFGDSKWDTGNSQLIFPTESRSETPPYGRTFFYRPSDRFCDGRLVIDFQAQAYGFRSFLSPYFRGVGSNFKHGANFAVSNSGVLPYQAGSQFFLQRQFNHFRKFKANYIEQQLIDASYLPPHVFFGEGLYVISTGENDYRVAILNDELTADEIKAQMVPRVIEITQQIVQGLYDEGARKFLVTGIAADGCISKLLTLLAHGPEDLDSMGCVKSVNDYVQYHNEMLLQSVKDLRAELPDAQIAYGDYFGINVEILMNATTYGFEETHKACCGIGGDYNYNQTVQCGETGLVNGRNVTVVSCEDPSKFLNWDGIHLTEHFYELVAKAFLEGNYVDEPIALPSSCYLNFSSFPHFYHNPSVNVY